MTTDLQNLESKLLALLSLHLETREDRLNEARPPELLLSEAGLSNHDIVKVTGKSQAAVAKAIQRAKRKRKK